MIYRISTFENNATFLFHNSRSRRGEASAIENLSSMKKVSKPSDNPLHYRRIATSKTEIGRTESFQQTIISMKQSYALVEDSLENMRSGIVRAREIVTQGANGPLGLESRRALAGEIDQIRNNILHELNTRHEGNYLFSGTAVDTQPFDLAGNYAGNTQDRTARINESETMRITINGEEIAFGAGGQGSNEDILDTLERIAAALRDPTIPAPDDLDTVALNLEPMQNRLNELISEVGTNTARLLQQQDSYEDFELNMRQTLADLEDADIAEEATLLSNHQTAIQSQLRSQSTLNRQSLLDFLG